MNQMQQATRSPHRGGLFGLAIALLIAVGVITGCGGSPTTGVQAATSTPRATATPTLPPTLEGRLTLRARQAVGAAAQQVTVAYQTPEDAAVVTVTLIWQPGWKDDFAQAQAEAKLACYQIQAALWTSGVPLSKVTALVLGQALDDYASVITSAYAEADLSAQHARGFKWSAMSVEQAWAQYDHEFLRPTYTPDWIYPPPTN